MSRWSILLYHKGWIQVIYHWKFNWNIRIGNSSDSWVSSSRNVAEWLSWIHNVVEDDPQSPDVHHLGVLDWFVVQHGLSVNLSILILVRWQHLRTHEVLGTQHLLLLNITLTWNKWSQCLNLISSLTFPCLSLLHVYGKVTYSGTEGILLKCCHHCFTVLYILWPGTSSMARPKSISFSWPATRRKFPGLMSAWMILQKLM